MAKLASGHVAEELQGEERDKQSKDWGYPNGLVRLTPDSWMFPKGFVRFADKYYNFEFRPTDVVVMTFPKCGTTWTQEIVWTMRNNPDLQNPMSTMNSSVRIPFIEFDMFESETEEHLLMEGFNMICKGRKPEDGMLVQMAEFAQDPRTIKTHLPFSLLPPSLIDTTKVVYVMRNPRDMLVSYHHHCRILKVHGFTGTWDDFIQYFLDDDLVYGSYALHIKEAWKKKNHPNFHIMYYEDMKKDVMHELKRLDTFLGTNLTPEQLENVAKHTSFKSMKAREGEITAKDDDANIFNVEITKKEGSFIRKGETGDWKNKFTPEMKAKVDGWVKDKLQNIDVDFKYSI